ncbi:MAG TPA: S8 family peptidase [Chitinophagaceae bacterium]
MSNYFKQSLLAFSAIGIGLASYAQTSHGGIPRGWHLKDQSKDGLYGISLDKAYDFVKGKKSQTVVVAVIDSGIDTLHEDLKPVLWRNPKEVAGNGIDDDKNGYVDDIHGWNFLGGKDGRNVKEDSYEAARVYHKYKAKFAGVTDPSTLSKEDQAAYEMWQRSEKQILGGGKESGVQVLLLSKAYEAAVKADSILRKAMGKESFTGTELDAFTPTTEDAKKAKPSFLYFFQANNSMDMTNKTFLEEFGEYLAGEKKKVEAADKAPKAYRAEIVKDNYEDFNDRFYGNSDVMANTPFHGTHVAGIIGAARGNGKGVDGVADNVRIMSIRAVPDGDEHDKDVALAIRYAVDNGAKVINMSFGKGFSPEKKWVDEAVQYAASKGVLLVHAAGNDASNIDSTHNYPSPVFQADAKKASNWLTVGASGDPKIGGVVAPFSNYGKSEVDVFAPGMKIYSTIPGGNTYGDAQGTSMASPVVAGVAAFLLQYYPTLTPEQVKQVIENSATKLTGKVNNPATGESVMLSDISKTGGVVNAYEAARLAAQITGGGAAKTEKTAPSKKASKKKAVKSF